MRLKPGFLLRESVVGSVQVSLASIRALDYRRPTKPGLVIRSLFRYIELGSETKIIRSTTFELTTQEDLPAMEEEDQRGIKRKADEVELSATQTTRRIKVYCHQSIFFVLLGANNVLRTSRWTRMLSTRSQPARSLLPQSTRSKN